MNKVMVGDSPLAIRLVYFADGSDKPATTLQLTPSTLSHLGPATLVLQPLLAPLTSVLTTPLKAGFDSAWAAQNVAAMLQANFIAQAQQDQTTVRNVSATAPALGKLWADALPATATDAGVLNLYYKVPGCVITFETQAVAAQAAADTASLGWAWVAGVTLWDEWKLSFDMDVSISSLVPLLPFSLDFTGNILSSNASTSAENANAALDYVSEYMFAALDLALNAIGIGSSSDTLSTQPFVPPTKEMDDGIDTTVTPLGNGLSANGLAGLLNAAGAAGSPPNVTSLGFTQCGFSTTAGSPAALLLTLTHPLDPGPQWAAAVLSERPTLSASASEVKPGAAIAAIGQNFPLDTTAALSVSWSNTSSGIYTGGAQIRIDGAGAIPVAAANPFLNSFTHSLSGLAPGTTHRFQARCSDNLTWSAWSSELSLTTLAGNEVTLALTSAASPSDATPIYTLGSARLSPSSPQWSCNGAIPADATPGEYLLSAILAGEILARAPITVATRLVPVLDIVDPATGLLNSPPAEGGASFAVRGENFPDGAVTITVTGSFSTTAQAVAGIFVAADLLAPGNVDYYGGVTVTAAAGAATASLSFEIYGQPK